jgi:Tfp pilus assembly protein PilO
VRTAVKNLNPLVLAGAAALVIGLVALVGWYGLVSPQRSKVDGLDAKITGEQAQLKVAQLLARSQKADKTKTSGTGLLVKAMPSSLQMPGILRQVQRLASTSSVTLESLTPSTATPAAGYDAVPIDLSVSGPYASVQKFLHGLRTQAGTKGSRIYADGRLFDVQTVGLAPGGDAANELTASIRLAAFVYTGAALPVTDTAAAADTDTEEAS